MNVGEVFAAFDHDRSGGWDEDELRLMLSSANLGDEKAPSFKALDLDTDGTLSQNEVQHLFPQGMAGDVLASGPDEFEYIDANGACMRAWGG